MFDSISKTVNEQQLLDFALTFSALIDQTPNLQKQHEVCDTIILSYCFTRERENGESIEDLVESNKLSKEDAETILLKEKEELCSGKAIEILLKEGMIDSECDSEGVFHLTLTPEGEVAAEEAIKKLG